MATASKTKKNAQTDAVAAPVAGGKKLKGTVVKAAMVGTITVKVDRFVKHPKYKKYYSIGKKYLVDDQKAEAKVGDVVAIIETRPLSKLKRFRLLSVLAQAKSAEGAIEE